MDIDDIWRVVIYGNVAIPAFIFTVLYLAHWRRVHRTIEAYHLLAFTGVIALIAGEFLMRKVFGAWEFNLAFLLSCMAVAGVLLWQRVYLILRYLVLPSWRRRHKVEQRVD